MNDAAFSATVECIGVLTPTSVSISFTKLQIPLRNRIELSAKFVITRTHPRLFLVDAHAAN